MKLQKSELKTDRQWRAATGFDQPRFEKLLALFSKSYFNLFGRTVVDLHAVLEITPHLASEEELLLFSLKSGLNL